MPPVSSGWGRGSPFAPPYCHSLWDSFATRDEFEARATSSPTDTKPGNFTGRNGGMTQVRVLAGTHKGAFVLTSDAKREKWSVSGPHFGGWDVYHLKGSPANPDRIWASVSSGWFGQIIQRSDDGGL